MTDLTAFLQKKTDQTDALKELTAFLQKNTVETDSLEDTSVRDYRILLARWAIDMDGLVEGIEHDRYRQEESEYSQKNDFLILTGLHSVVFDPQEEDYDAATLSSIFRKKLDCKRREAELSFWRERLKERRCELAATPLNSELPLFKNVAHLGEMLNLNLIEQAILIFTVFVTGGDDLFHQVVARLHLHVNGQKLCRILAVLIGVPPSDIQKALNPKGLLVSTGLIKDDHYRNICDLEDRLEIPNRWVRVLMTSYPDAASFIGCFFKPVVQKSALTLTNFPHLQKDSELLSTYLQNILANKVNGSNVLLYGEPGVGKTEYAAALAKAIGANLYEVNYEDEDGDPIEGEARLGAFTLCQRFLMDQQHTLLLFDEIEDVFKGGGHDDFMELFGSSRKERAQGGKGWINRALENNPVPTLWITNDKEAMDAAYLRRFHYSIRFQLPPQAVRVDITRYHLATWDNGDDWLDKIARQGHLTPAQLDLAAKLAHHMGNSDINAARSVIEQALDRSATLLGQKSAPLRSVAPTGYDLRYLNTDQARPLSQFIGALQRHAKVTCCFYGPPGTGKSELARHVADRLEKPLLVKRASDILDKYVGETERKIAEMFHEAQQQGAVLVLDEADSFLRDRSHAQRSWEITQVNELLTQMETFEGIFICTTNLMSSLDQASLRRFTFKISFRYLTPNQRWALFAQELHRLGGDLDEAIRWKSAIQGLESLTPGDFATVVREYILWGEIPFAAGFYDRLQKEVMHKKQNLDDSYQKLQSKAV